MERVGILLAVLVGCSVAAEPTVQVEDSAFSREFPRLFQDIGPLPIQRDFVPVFSSWPVQISDFHLLEDWPPVPRVPRVEVSCDGSKLNVLVWKDLGRVPLTAEEVQLGDGCYSTAELPHHLVFTYNLDECGTSYVTDNGLHSFTNTLYILDLARAWWKAPSTVDIACATSRPAVNPDLVDPQAPPENDTKPFFSMRAVNSAWTGDAESNVYDRGQMINLQVSATSRPEQQLFIRSCFVSTSPEPHARPRHALIMNQGCASGFGSAHSAAQFVASHQEDVVNFVVNPALSPEVYVHCNVFLSDHGVTVASKSCNYNATEKRWEELSGVLKVCDCCSAKCKSPTVKISEGAESFVTAGPFVIVDQDVEKESSFASAEDTDSEQSDDADSGSGESLPRLESHPRSVLAVDQKPGASPPADHQPEERSSVVPDLAEDQQTPTNVMSSDGVSVVSLAVIPHLEAAAVGEGLKTWLTRLGLAGVKVRRHVDSRLDATTQEGYGLDKDEPLTLDANDDGTVVRSKVQFTKTADGTQTLSYEEELKPEDEHVAPCCGRRTHREPGRRRRLRSTFLNFLRRLDRAE